MATSLQRSPELPPCLSQVSPQSAFLSASVFLPFFFLSPRLYPDRCSPRPPPSELYSDEFQRVDRLTSPLPEATDLPGWSISRLLRLNRDPPLDLASERKKLWETMGIDLPEKLYTYEYGVGAFFLCLPDFTFRARLLTFISSLLFSGSYMFMKSVEDSATEPHPSKPLRGLWEDYGARRERVLHLQVWLALFPSSLTPCLQTGVTDVRFLPPLSRPQGEFHHGFRLGSLLFTSAAARDNFTSLILHGSHPPSQYLAVAERLEERMRQRTGGRAWVAAHMRRSDFVRVGWQADVSRLPRCSVTRDVDGEGGLAESRASRSMLSGSQDCWTTAGRYFGPCLCHRTLPMHLLSAGMSFRGRTIRVSSSFSLATRSLTLRHPPCCSPLPRSPQLLPCNR
jgi:hypothetical protein